MSEIRYALRTLIKAPGPTVVMMLTLGVAVGAATVIYSVIDRRLDGAGQLRTRTPSSIDQSGGSTEG